MGFRKKYAKMREAKIDEYYSQFKVKCKCGHTFPMPYTIDKLLCDHCGVYYYRDKKLEFKERMKQAMKGEKYVR